MRMEERVLVQVKTVFSKPEKPSPGAVAGLPNAENPRTKRCETGITFFEVPTLED